MYGGEVSKLLRKVNTWLFNLETWIRCQENWQNILWDNIHRMLLIFSASSILELSQDTYLQENYHSYSQAQSVAILNEDMKKFLSTAD